MRDLLAALIVFGLAALVQSASGFGFALVAVPLLSLTVGPRSAVVAATLVSVALTGVTAVLQREHVRWRAAGRLMAWALPGMPLGLIALRALPAKGLTALIGAVTLGCTIMVWRQWRLRRVSGWPVASVGVLSGVLTTTTGTEGPPLVAALQALGLGPREFRATMAVMLTGAAVVGTGLFGLGGILSEQALVLAAYGIPAAAAGGFAGHRAIRGIDHQKFRRVVLSALAASSIMAIFALR